MIGYLLVALAVLVAVVGWRVRHRLRHQTRGGVTDEIVDQIETLGRVDAEDVELIDAATFLAPRLLRMAPTQPRPGIIKGRS